MSRRTARVTLAFIVVGTLVGLWFIPITPANRIWPMPHHTNLLMAVVTFVGWALITLAAIIGVLVGIVKLWEAAEL